MSSLPTVDDLRVRTCYICLEEENFDDPGEKSEEWVHPCKCTLVAHQSCLMKVIFRKKLRRRSRIKCPQCQFPYAIERNQKLVFTCLLFEIGDKLVGLAGTAVFIAGAAGIAFMALSGALTAGSAYGSWAVQQYFGDELFDLLLTKDSSNWPARYFILFPALSIRTMSRSMTGFGSFTPMFFWWPSMPPAAVRQHLMSESNLIRNVTVASSSTSSLSRSTWPPSLSRFGWIVLASNMIYSRVFSRFSHWVLGTKPDPPPRRRRGLINLLTFGLFGRREEERNPAGEGQVQAQGQAQEEPNPGEGDVNFNLLEALTKVGEFSVLLGLAKPAIAKGMGHLLFLASTRSRILRDLLGIRHTSSIQTLMSMNVPSPRLVPTLLDPEMDNTWYWRYFTEQAIDNIDPVWIRNSIGLGIFVVIKDLLHLFHLWVTKRELASRKLKSRPFDDVDPAQLDLIKPPPLPSATTNEEARIPGESQSTSV
ncbi:hypothetical protein VKT23_001376 [Stygiomarasmius scandens]|uniref:RING-CH-type domain-containing protein n=1 Tax=Marasmiellus scandens TaxID=2682957 RepID=A0ABR1K781_9AGAR